jgi:hypothetical protein
MADKFSSDLKQGLFSWPLRVTELTVEMVQYLAMQNRHIDCELRETGLMHHNQSKNEGIKTPLCMNDLEASKFLDAMLTQARETAHPRPNFRNHFGRVFMYSRTHLKGLPPWRFLREAPHLPSLCLKEEPQEARQTSQISYISYIKSSL